MDALPRPLGGQPRGDGVGEWDVKLVVAGPHPRLHRDVGVGHLRGVEVDAADHVARGRLEDGERETLAGLEVGGVAAEVVEVPFERHAIRRRPVAVGVAGGGADVGDARCPGGVVGLVVLWAERLEPEVLTDQGGRRREVGRDERRVGGHDPETTCVPPSSASRGVAEAVTASAPHMAPMLYRSRTARR